VLAPMAGGNGRSRADERTLQGQVIGLEIAGHAATDRGRPAAGVVKARGRPRGRRQQLGALGAAELRAWGL
jgi:hypothetical protein